MRLYSIKIKEAVFKVAVISDEQDMKKGLSGKPSLKENRGLLFNFGKEGPITMNMRGMRYPIDMIFINSSREVIKVKTMQPGNSTITVADVRYVIEVNAGEGKGLLGGIMKLSKSIVKELGLTLAKKSSEVSNIIIKNLSSDEMFKRGGRFKIQEGDVKAKRGAMQVLDDKGTVLMNIVGGERIFSIKHTDKLIALAKKIDLGEADEEELGKLMAEIIEIQNTQESQYTDD